MKLKVLALAIVEKVYTYNVDEDDHENEDQFCQDAQDRLEFEELGDLTVTDVRTLVKWEQ